MNAYGGLAAVVVAGAALVGSYVQGRADGRDACQAQEARDKAVAQIAGAAAAASAAEAISKQEVKNVTITQKLQREVVTKEVFRDCRSGPDAVGLFNSAIPSASVGSIPGGGKLPASDPAAR